MCRKRVSVWWLDCLTQTHINGRHRVCQCPPHAQRSPSARARRTQRPQLFHLESVDVTSSVAHEAVLLLSVVSVFIGDRSTTQDALAPSSVFVSSLVRLLPFRDLLSRSSTLFGTSRAERLGDIVEFGVRQLTRWNQCWRYLQYGASSHTPLPIGFSIDLISVSHPIGVGGGVRLCS